MSLIGLNGLYECLYSFHEIEDVNFYLNQFSIHFRLEGLLHYLVFNICLGGKLVFTGHSRAKRNRNYAESLRSQLTEVEVDRLTILADRLAPIERFEISSYRHQYYRHPPIVKEH